jgi:hypothetical protein
MVSFKDKLLIKQIESFITENFIQKVYNLSWNSTHLKYPLNYIMLSRSGCLKV